MNLPLAVAAAAFIAYLPSFWGVFQFDDYNVIVHYDTVHLWSALAERWGGGVRPLLKAGGLSRSAEQPQLVEVQRPRTVADLENEIEAQMDAQIAEKASENRKLPVLTRRVSAITKKEPDQVAKLLRGWIREAER